MIVIDDGDWMLLKSALSANIEFQTGFHDQIDQILELAERCKSLTAEADAIEPLRANAPEVWFIAETPDPLKSVGEGFYDNKDVANRHCGNLIFSQRKPYMIHRAIVVPADFPTNTKKGS
jgi:hypothetical protein